MHSWPQLKVFRRGQYAGEYSGYQDRGNITCTNPPRPYDNFSGGSRGGTRPLFLDQTGARRPGPGAGSPSSQGLEDRSPSPLSAGRDLPLNFGRFHTVWTGHLK